MIKTRETILELLKECKKKYSKPYGLSKIALFGSYARGEQTQKSDVDIYVEVDPKIGLEFVTLAGKIEDELGLTVDLISSRAIKKKYFNLIEPELIYV